MKLSIIIPAHNEEHRLPQVLKAYAEFFSQKMGGEVEIIVVANNCSDATTEVAEAEGKNYAQIKVITDPKNIGKGGAIILGAKVSTGEYVGFVDADGATAPEEFHRLYEKSVGSDGVIASRWLAQSNVTISQKGLRRLSSRVFNLLIRVLLGLKYKDTQCGAKIFKKTAWKAILSDIGTTRFAFDVDVLFQLKRNGCSVKEEPTTWRDIEGSKVQVLQTSIEMFLAVIRMRLIHSRLKFIVGYYDRIFARPVEFLLSDKLFRHAMLLFSATMMASIFNVGYQMVIGRALSKEDYALLATFLAAIAIVSRPLGSVSTALNRYTSLLVSDDRTHDVRKLLVKWTLLLGSLAAVLTVLCISFSPQIAAFFNLDRVAPVVVSAVAIPVLFLSPVFVGILLGLQRFGWSSLSSVVGASGRFVLGSVFVFFIYPACGWALAGHVGGLYLSLLVTGGVLLPVLLNKKRSASSKKPLPRLRFYLIQSLIFQLAAGVLLTGDVIFVKHYLPDEGSFAYAATLSRIVAFMAMSVAGAMFPKVVSNGTFSDDHRRLYLRSLLYTSGFIVLSLFVCLVLPRLLLRILFHITDPSSELLSLTRWMSVAMAFATLLNINLNLLLAQRRLVSLLSVLGCAAFYGVVTYFYHETTFQIVIFALVSNLIALVVTTLVIIRRQPLIKDSPE